MADKDIFGIAESGTYSTSAPDPHVDLADTSPAGYSIVQLFVGGMSTGETATVTIRKDAANWAIYSGATYTTGTPNIVDLSTGTLLESAGSISNTDTVDVLGLAPDSDLASLNVGSSLVVNGTVLDNPAMTAGFINRTDTSLVFASNTFSLTKVNNFRVWAGSTPYDYTATEAIPVADATNFYYLAIGTDGELAVGTTVWDIAGGAAPCATIYYNADHPTEYVLSDERHSYLRNPLAHKSAHLSVGAYWISGLVGSFGDTDGAISIGPGSFADEDVVHTFAGTLTQAKVVYRDATGWRVDALASDIRKTGTYIQYDNDGTLTDVGTANQCAVYWVYAVGTSTPEIHVVVGQSQHTTTTALSVTPDSLTLPPWIQAEGRLLYKVIYQRTAGTPAGDIYQLPIDYRTVKISGGVTLSGSFLSSGLPAGQLYVGNASNIATPVTISGDLTISDAGVADIADGAVSLAEMANLAQDQFIGRVTSSTGVPETATITAAARTVLDDATVSAMVDTLGGASATGTGGIVRATSPTFVTPILGTPSSGTLTNCSGYPAASTSAAGVAPQATAPSSGLRNVVAIDNGETAYTNKALFDATNPAALGSASPGTAMTAARRDHVHDAPAAWDGDIADINLDGGTDIGAALADADLILVDDGAGGTNRKSALSRIWTYILSKIQSSSYPTLLFGIAVSDETTDLTTGQKAAFDVPFSLVLTRIYCSVTTAAAGANLQVDVEDEGTSLLNAVFAFQANNAETSTFASSASSYAMTKGDLLTIDIDQVGSGTAGAGLKVFFEGYRT